eukprot:1255031-Rhodomonas_salina.1
MPAPPTIRQWIRGERGLYWDVRRWRLLYEGSNRVHPDPLGGDRSPDMDADQPERRRWHWDKQRWRLIYEDEDEDVGDAPMPSPSSRTPGTPLHRPLQLPPGPQTPSSPNLPSSPGFSPAHRSRLPLTPNANARLPPPSSSPAELSATSTLLPAWDRART